MEFSNIDEWLLTSWDNLSIVLLSCVLIYVAVIAMTRYSGLRTFAKMSSFDFAITIAIGSVIATTVLNNGQSVLQGAAVLFTLVTLQMLFSILKIKSKLFKSLTTNTPILLMDGSTILYDNLYKARVSESELIAKLREANVIKISEVLAVVLETTGDISVLHSSNDSEVDAIVMKFVDRK